LHLIMRQYSSEISFLAPGDSALVTPLFFWPASHYNSNPRHFGLSQKQFLNYSLRYTRGRSFAHVASKSPSVACTNTGLVLQNHVVGVNKAKLLRSVPDQQNGEHDEALSLLTSLNNTSASITSDALRAIAEASQSTWLDRAKKRKYRTYALARANFAKKVAFAASGSSTNQVLDVLHKVSSKQRSIYAQ
jgi:hypothetical protein